MYKICNHVFAYVDYPVIFSTNSFLGCLSSWVERCDGKAFGTLSAGIRPSIAGAPLITESDSLLSACPLFRCVLHRTMRAVWLQTGTRFSCIIHDRTFCIQQHSVRHFVGVPTPGTLSRTEGDQVWQLLLGPALRPGRAAPNTAAQQTRPQRPEEGRSDHVDRHDLCEGGHAADNDGYVDLDEPGLLHF